MLCPALRNRIRILFDSPNLKLSFRRVVILLVSFASIPLEASEGVVVLGESGTQISEKNAFATISTFSLLGLPPNNIRKEKNALFETDYLGNASLIIQGLKRYKDSVTKPRTEIFHLM